jgi:hypothetical protein
VGHRLIQIAVRLYAPSAKFMQDVEAFLYPSRTHQRIDNRILNKSACVREGDKIC